MRLKTYAARGVRDEIDVVAVAERMDDRERQADLSPESGHDEPLPAGLPHPLDNALVFPGIDERAIDGLLFRKDILELLENVAAAFFCYRRQERRYLVQLGSLRQGHDVVDDRLRIVAL